MMTRNFARFLLFLTIIVVTVSAGDDKRKDAAAKVRKTIGPDIKAIKEKRKENDKRVRETEVRKEGPKDKLKEKTRGEKKEDAKKKVTERKEAFKREVKPREVLASKEQLKDALKEKTLKKIEEHKKLSRTEIKEVDKVEMKTYQDLRRKGVDEVGNSRESAMLRDYRLRNKKRTGFFRKKPASLAQIMFPGVSPEDYMEGERVWIYTDLVESRMTPVPFEVYDLPGYFEGQESKFLKQQRMRRNLGARLQGHELKPAPFRLVAKIDVPCQPYGKSYIGSKELIWLRQLVERQYRVNLQLDGLPVLLKNHAYNFALRGYPVGFKLADGPDRYLYNHLKFTITYHEDPNMFSGIRITGFEVHPVSIRHKFEGGGSSTCSGMGVENSPDKSTYLSLETELASESVAFTYDVKWESSEVRWADRWDVYMIGAPDDDIHYYSIVNSFMIVVIMTAAISSIMLRTLRKDIAGYNELVDLEDGEEETGWKLVHGDVFRPPMFSPMALSILVGTGAQIGVASVLALLLSIVHVTNAVQKGQMLTSLILLYVLSGSVAGFTSARIYKLCQGKAWKLNTLLTATALPGACVCLFTFLNVFLSHIHAATAVSFLTIVCLFLLWVGVSTPLVFLGACCGLRGQGIEVMVKTNTIERIIPESIWSTMPVVTVLCGGILPFGSVCIELTFIMSAMWLHQMYYVMGFLLVVLIILFATCAQVSMVMSYFQLCAEDYQWWWKSFWNCASSGIYLFLYSVWFLTSRLHIIGGLPVLIYLLYMGLISVLFGMLCGSIGFFSSLWFTKKIYGAVKLD